jgi:hypothetical protein
MYGLQPVPFNDGCAVASTEMSTACEVILLTSEGTKVRCEATIWDRPLRASFYQRTGEFGGSKNVPQRLKPRMAMSFMARLNPCPSRTECSHTGFPGCGKSQGRRAAVSHISQKTSEMWGTRRLVAGIEPKRASLRFP